MANEIADKIFANLPHVQFVWVTADGKVFIHPVAKAEKVLRPTPVKEVKTTSTKKGAKNDASKKEAEEVIN
jgi:hypothetical protein